MLSVLILYPQIRRKTHFLLFDNQFVGVAVGVGGEEVFGHPEASEGADFDALFALNALSGEDGDAFFFFADFNGVGGADFGAHAATGTFFFFVVNEAFVAFTNGDGRGNGGFAFRDFGEEAGDRRRQVFGDEGVGRRFAEELFK